MSERNKYRRLRGAMVAADVSRGDIATLLHLSETAVSNRFCDRLPWRLNEMYAILDFLGVDEATAVLGTYFPRNGIEEDSK